VAKVTRELVLEGIVRHTVEARVRLEDGLSLFEQARYGSAVILGTIALEDIGRAYWLAPLADDASGRAKFTVQSLAKELKGMNHEEILKRGLNGLSIDNAPTINEQALRRTHGADWEKALARNVAATKKLHNKAPEAGCSWKSSTDVTVAEARRTMRGAAENLYLIQTFCLNKIAGLRELSRKLGLEDATFDYLEPYARLGMKTA
jgi:hypothetical protein